LWGGAFAPITWRLGFLETSLSVCAEELVAWRREIHGGVTAIRVDRRMPDAFHSLKPLTLAVRPRVL
jgi:hypothetical protein